MNRLTSLSALPPSVKTPTYDPLQHGSGIVHLGVGAFHKAHQAVYTDDALAKSGGDWRIAGISLRGLEAAEGLNPQDGLYTVLERGIEGTAARVIGSMAKVIAAATDSSAMMAELSRPQCRIVSLTVTEKAYGIVRANGMADENHPAVAHDLRSPQAPIGVLGILTRALENHRHAGVPPFTVLCCDNLPENGRLLRAGVLDFARRTNPALADWIAETVPFPSTMVDRITPAATEKTFADAAALLGFEDRAAIETEPFTQWVIEDNFISGRPEWEAGGAIFTADVAPYENMKLRMLNGSHSMIAYAGFLCGKVYVRDVMKSPALSRLVQRHLAAAASTLDALENIDFSEYAAQLAARFENPAIAHETYQIAMDGSQKMPQRIFTPALAALERGQNIRPFAFATAAWMRYVLGRKDDGSTYDLRDPSGEAINRAISGQTDAQGIYTALLHSAGLLPAALGEAEKFRTETISVLQRMLDNGVEAAIEAEAFS